ncbi:thioesterase [Actinomadura sp. KC216]|uniref:thioesterase II family protein n=1 Tax=Actinomadura sp. KC216 TaxID=2530370 RepID=UPI001052DE17|nr:thioesterase domain-containing protein [Actinomadura sp. KC216]TDB86233.1 thioesterase [Actinomadura sp. KC216]
MALSAPMAKSRSRTLLYCFPHAGGLGGMYREWADELGPDVEIHVAGYNGLTEASRRDEPSVTGLAAACAERIRPCGAQRTAFFGHSLGALVAFETARTLQERGWGGPGVLFASGRVAPHLESPGPVLHALEPDRFWDEVAALGGTPGELLDSPEVRAVAEPRLRAEFQAAETYKYGRGRPLACDVVAFAGTDDSRTSTEGMAAWAMHTLGEFDLLMLPGEHFFVESRRAEVLDRIRAAVSR